MAFSPLLLGMSRLVLSDSFRRSAPVAVWSFLELVESPSSRRWLWIFCVSFAWVILVKELTILRSPDRSPLRAGRAVLARQSAAPCDGFTLALPVPPLCTLPIFRARGRSPSTLIVTLRHVLTSPATTTMPSGSTRDRGIAT